MCTTLSTGLSTPQPACVLLLRTRRMAQLILVRPRLALRSLKHEFRMGEVYGLPSSHPTLP